MASVLVLNSGSSSVKFALFGLDAALHVSADAHYRGSASHLGEPTGGHLQLKPPGAGEVRVLSSNDHAGAIDAILDDLRERALLDSVIAVGHRVVHGGAAYRAPTLLSDTDLQRLEQFNAYAPLHNPPNLLGIHLCRERLPTIPQIAIFDTAFHSTLPPVAYHYAVPYQWQQELGVRRYGFHGISHHFIALQLPALLKQPTDSIRAVSAHLGNGCSLCAIRGQISVDTSMGFTPLEGLVMGSRSGDLDPGLHAYLCDRLSIDIHQLTALLNQSAGLKGVSGLSNDMRECLQAADAGNARAALAVELFCYRLAKQIASYLVPLGRIEALVFTGGIGEHAAPVRSRVIEWLSGLGFRLDPAANARSDTAARNIALPDSPPILVIPTREEWLIAQQTVDLLQTTGSLA